MSRRERALALTAAAVPILQLCPGLGWLPTLVGGAAASALLFIICKVPFDPGVRAPGEKRPVTRASALLLAAALAGLAAWAARESECAFPQTDDHPLPGCLLALLAWTAARRGSTAPARCASVLFPILAALGGVVLGFSLPQLRAEWLRPSWRPEAAARACGALLLPGSVLCLPAEGPRRAVPAAALGAAVTAALAAAVTGGILSPALAQGPKAFWTLSRSVSVLGVVRRFEALVSAALLIGGFSLSALLLAAARAVCGRAAPAMAQKLYDAALPVLLGLICCAEEKLYPICGIGAICSGLVCIGAQEIEKQKKFEKKKNNA